MIVLFTSNSSGGILQFSVQIMCELKNLNVGVCCFVPEKACTYFNEQYKSNIILYESFSSLKLQISKVKKIGDTILDKKPQLVWYMDNLSNSVSVGLYLTGKVKQILTLHDIQPHPSYIGNLKKTAASYIINRLTWKFIKKVNYLLLMSDESYELSVKETPKYADKMLKLTLGAHLPETQPSGLIELNNLEKPFFLFFGRLDRYKGIKTILKAYELDDNCEARLVIAGQGVLTEEEKMIIDKDRRIILVNRYIEDGEMVWLFQHTQATILPYIEASQSGIIPISYLYGVPVITSNVAGLVQYVEDEKTGLICREVDDYVKAIQKISQREYREKMSIYCKQYYEKNMDWHNNLKKLLNIVLTT